MRNHGGVCRACLRVMFVNRRIMGVADGSIMATIITDHMANMAAKSVPDQAPAAGIPAMAAIPACIPAARLMVYAQARAQSAAMEITTIQRSRPEATANWNSGASLRSSQSAPRRRSVLPRAVTAPGHSTNCRPRAPTRRFCFETATRGQSRRSASSSYRLRR